MLISELTALQTSSSQFYFFTNVLYGKQYRKNKYAGVCFLLPYEKKITFAWHVIAAESFQRRIHLNTSINDGGKHWYNSFQILMDLPPLGHAIFLCLLLYINTVNNPELSFIFCRREISRPCQHRGAADSLAGFSQSTSPWKIFLQWYKRNGSVPWQQLISSKLFSFELLYLAQKN